MAVSTTYFDFFSIDIFNRIGGQTERGKVLRKTLFGTYEQCTLTVDGRSFEGVIYKSRHKTCIVSILGTKKEISRAFVDCCRNVIDKQGTQDRLQLNIDLFVYNFCALGCIILNVLSSAIMAYGVILFILFGPVLKSFVAMITALLVKVIVHLSEYVRCKPPIYHS